MLNVACFVQSCLTDADFVIFSNYCLIGTRLKAFVCFYEEYARKMGCKACRMDTLEWNSVARAMYRKLGYAEVDIVNTELQGLSNVSMVLLEKYLG